MNNLPTLHAPNRCHFLGANALALSAGAIALLGGKDAFAAAKPVDVKNDLAILNVAVGLEHESINAYAIALKSGLQSAQHVTVATIRKLGGQPVEARTLDEYAKALKVDLIRNDDDVLDLAARLELGATNAYLGVITAFKDPALGKIAARLAADEAGHFALLNFDLKRPLSKAFAFGV